MKKFFVFTTAFISSFLLFPAAPTAESFRVHAVKQVTITSDMAPANINAGINDALSLVLPKDMTFIQGIELDVKIPRDVAEWRDSIAYSLYDNVKPTPSENKIDYSGDRISVATFPGKLSLTIFIPLSETTGLKNDPYTALIPVIPNISNGQIFFRMQLAMKGVPETFEKAQFEITIKPSLINKGKIKLNVTEPKPEESHPYTVYIDDEPFNYGKGNLLNSGEHHLSISSDFYRNEVRSFRIDQAKVTKLDISLRDIAPTVRITAPENTTVFFDNNQLDHYKDAFTIAPGDHIVKFTIGDYEVVKTVSAVNGRSYTVSLSIDAVITEDE